MVKRGPEAVDVAEKGIGQPVELFRRHVEGRGPEILREILAALLQGEAEIDELRGAFAGDEHVARLDVAVDELLSVGRVEPAGHVEGDPEHLGLGKGALVRNELLEADRLQQLHRDEEIPMIATDRVNLHHVRMDDRRGELRLALEHGDERFVAAERLMEDFQGDLASEIAVEGAEDLAHPAFAEGPRDFILPHRRAHPDDGGAMGALDLRVGRETGDIERFPAFGTVHQQRGILGILFHPTGTPGLHLPGEQPVYPDAFQGPDNSTDSRALLRAS